MRASTIEVEALTIDLAARTVAIQGKPIDCGRREFRLLEILVAKLGQVAPKERLMDQVFSLDDEVSINALELLVSRLRRKLQGAGIEIVTMRGAGYMARRHDGT